MLADEFLAQLKAETEKEKEEGRRWQSTASGLRIHLSTPTNGGSQYYCPLTYLAYRLHGKEYGCSKYEDAAGELGISQDLAHNIVQAADLGPMYTDCLTPYEKTLRTQLFEVAGLVEPPSPYRLVKEPQCPSPSP